MSSTHQHPAIHHLVRLVGDLSSVFHPRKKIVIHEGVYVFHRFFLVQMVQLPLELDFSAGFSCSQVPRPTAGAATAGQWGVLRGDGRCGGVLFFFFDFVWRGTPLKTNGWNPKIDGWGRCFSFSNGVFSGSMLVFGVVAILRV